MDNNDVICTCLDLTIGDLKKAIELLISTNLTLTEIAYECGFSSQSYFSQQFRKEHGAVLQLG